MTLKDFDQYPGRSPGYGFLPVEVRQQIVQDVPLWSEFIRQQSEQAGISYVDMSGSFTQHLQEARNILIGK